MASSRIGSRLAVVASGLVTSLALATGCSSNPASLEDGPIQSRSDAIIKGTPDTTHQAVMLLNCTTNCLCSGTLVKKDESSGVGWIVTAAHCLPDPGKGPVPRFFVQGDKAATFTAGLASTIEPGAIRYPVLDWVRHPDYKPATPFDGPINDVGLVRILGVGPEPPILPLAGAVDTLAAKLAVVDVGYGSSGKLNDANNVGLAGTRQRANVQIKSVDAKLVVTDGNDSGGAFNLGDDGGPVIAMVGGVETVVAVHSARVGFGNTTQNNARIGAVRTWLDGELAKVQKLDNCNSCFRIVTSGAHACAPTSLGCLDNADCNAFALCVEACSDDDNAGPTKACRAGCVAAHPKAPALYDPSVSCGCQACAVICGATCDGESVTTTTDAGTGAPATSAPSAPPVTGTGNVTGAPTETGCGVGAVPVDCSGVASTAFAFIGALAGRRRRARRARRV